MRVAIIDLEEEVARERRRLHITSITCEDDDEPEPRDMLMVDDAPELDPGQRGPCPGHEWAFTGTQYGGDDESYSGEGRAYCVHCGADGDA